MPSLLLCDQTTPTALLARELGLDDEQIRDRFGKVPRWVQADTPYLLGCEHDWGEQDLCAMLEPQGRMLTRMCLDYGPQTTLALADMREDLKRCGEVALDAASAGTALFDKHMGRFMHAVGEYHQAMVEFHRVTRGGPFTRKVRAAALQQLRVTGARLNREFALELQAVSRRLTPRFRTLSRAGAGVPQTIRNTPKAKKLDIASRIDATRLMDMADKSRQVNRILTLLDLGLRFQEVREVAEAGGNWPREAFSQTVGFYGALLGTQVIGMATSISVGVVVTETRSLSAAIAVGAAGVGAAVWGAENGDALGQAVGAGIYDFGASMYEAGSKTYDSLTHQTRPAP